MDSEVLFEWLKLLDSLDYYELLFELNPDAPPEDVKRAFHAFAATFHPDAHPTRTDEEKRALDTIFKRGTEAYAVLSDPDLRAEYDAAFAKAAATESGRPPRMVTIPPTYPRASSDARSLEDIVRTRSAVPFARRAAELIEAGDLRQAKLQLVIAKFRDPGNDALEAYIRALDAKLNA